MSVTQQHRKVEKARPIHARQLAAVLSSAFFDDPVFRWAIPDDDRRRAALPAFFDAFVAAFAPHDETYTTSAGTGAALWAPPGVAPVRDEDAEDFESALLAACGPDVERMTEIMELLGSTHPHEDCWYLNLLAVDPSAQGQGIGTALLDAVLTLADVTGTPAYLEATSPENRRLYERHGFVCTAELRVSDCPPLYAMWRRP